MLTIGIGIASCGAGLLPAYAQDNCVVGDDGNALDIVATTSVADVATIDQRIYSVGAAYHQCIGESGFSWKLEGAYDHADTDPGPGLAVQKTDVVRGGVGITSWMPGPKGDAVETLGWLGADASIGYEDFALPFLIPGAGQGGFAAEVDSRVAIGATVFGGHKWTAKADGLPIAVGGYVQVEGRVGYADKRSPEATGGSIGFNEAFVYSDASVMLSHPVPTGFRSSFQYYLGYEHYYSDDLFVNSIGKVQVGWVPEIAGNEVAFNVGYRVGNNDYSSWVFSIGSRF